MDIFVLICEAYSDDERLLGVYGSEAEARAAWDTWEGRSYYDFARIEVRQLGGEPREHDPRLGCIDLRDSEDEE